MQAIKTTELVKRYKNLTAVDKLHLEIQQGELFSLLGVNGAGKTTTIKMLSCLTNPTGGEALVGGYSTTKEPEQVKRLIGVSPQETAVAPNLSVKENLELICGIHSFSKEKTEAKIRELSGQFALDIVLKRKAGKLSGGWQRRVSIAMALISEPQILFLDEPTLGLDVIARHELWETIRSLKGKCHHSHTAVSSFTIETNAVSKSSVPAFLFNSSTVPTARRLPLFIIPMRSERDSASSM